MQTLVVMIEKPFELASAMPQRSRLLVLLKRTIAWIIAAALLIGFFAFCFQHRTIVSVTTDPTGRYSAVTSFKSYLSLLPMPPGSSGDKPCFVKISDKDGTSLGELAVPMCQLAHVEWTERGARVSFVGEWDFVSATCFHWSEDQNSKVFIKID